MATGSIGQTVTHELREWIATQRSSGCRDEDIVSAMCASGWADAVAAAALRDVALAQGGGTPAGAVLPEPEPADARSVIMLPDREVTVLMALTKPRVLLFGDLLSHDECDALVALARPRMARSQTVDKLSGGSEVNDARTSDGMFFERGETALIETLERRIAALLRWPLERGEGLQVLRYGEGAEYRPHFDYFDPAHPGSAAVLQRGGQRLGTLIMYLSTPQRGGATVFPDAGLQVAPIKGNAVFFNYDRPSQGTGTLHGGAPVQQGEKWVATKWLREAVFE